MQRVANCSQTSCPAVRPRRRVPARLSLRESLQVDRVRALMQKFTYVVEERHRPIAPLCPDARRGQPTYDRNSYTTHAARPPTRTPRPPAGWGARDARAHKIHCVGESYNPGPTLAPPAGHPILSTVQTRDRTGEGTGGDATRPPSRGSGPPLCAAARSTTTGLQVCNDTNKQTEH